MENIYRASHLSRQHHTVSLNKETELLAELEERTDTDGERLKRYIALPDLTRLEGSPVKAITERIINLPSLRGFDLIETPEIIPANIVFDLFNFPEDHPARSRSDTYYVDGEHILRPHTSLMWKYYLEVPEVLEKLKDYGTIGAICYGTVYRRDEIDWQHSNVLHHIDGLFIARRNIKVLDQTDLENILIEVAQSLYGKDVRCRLNIEHYPYTDPSLEMEIWWQGKWVEILGAGIVHPKVIDNLGLDSSQYTGWAFGFGADRLAMFKMGIPDIRLLRSADERIVQQLKDIDTIYKPVSKYPPVIRDISFIVEKTRFNLNQYYEMIREVVGEDYIEEAKLLDQYEDETKFGDGKTSYTFRIIYRHLDRTLTNEEVDITHKRLEEQTKLNFGASIR